MNFYLATVALEPNRWTTREPSFLVSEFVPLAQRDGYDGIELWEHHFAKASKEEQAKLCNANMPCIYNCYTTFAQPFSAVHEALVEQATALHATALKFNFSNNMETLAQEIETVRAVAARLPQGVKMLCECHPGTLLDAPEVAQQVFAQLEEDRFGAIVHLAPQHLDNADCFAAYGARIAHLHVQLCLADEPNTRCKLSDRAQEAKKHLQQLQVLGFDGTVSMEFTKEGSTILETYQNTVEDLQFIKDFRHA